MTEETKNLTATDVKAAKKSFKSKSSSLWWGMFLVIFGVLLALSSLNILSLNFWALIRYWPLLLVSAGLTLISRQNKALFVLATIGKLALLVVAGLVVTGVVDHQNIAEPVSGRVDLASEVRAAEVSLKAAGNINIQVDDLDGVLDYRGTNLKLERKRINQVETVALKADKDSFDWMNSQNSTTELILSRNLPLELEIDAGTGSVKADLRGARLRKLDVDAGASDIELRLDSLDQKEVLVDLDLGLANAVLWLPKEAGVYVVSKDGLTNLDLPELESKGKGVYQSQNLDQAKVIYRIKLDAGLTNFALKRLAE